MNSKISHYFPTGMKYVSPTGNDDMKMTFHYFEKNEVKPVDEPWSSYRYNKKYEGLKLFYSGKVLNLKSPPSFLDQFPHIPGTIAEGYISIHNFNLHIGQIIEKDEADIWYYDIIEKRYYHIGKAIIDQVLNKEIGCWTPKAFIDRYKEKLELLTDTTTFEIELADAFSNLKFIDKVSVRLTSDIEQTFKVVIEYNIDHLLQEHLEDILRKLEYVSLGNNRYRINFENAVISHWNLTYQDLRILFASWSEYEYVTAGISFESTKLHTAL